MDFAAVLIDVLETSIEPVIVAWAALLMLPMRHRASFAAIEVVGALLTSLLFGPLLHWTGTGFVLMMVLSLGIPLVFWKAPWPKRVGALFLIQVCVLVSYAVTQVCWESLFGMPAPDDWSDEMAVYRSNLDAWAIYELIFIAVAAALIVPVARWYRRWATRAAEGASGGESPVFPLLLAAQLLLALVVCGVCLARPLGTAGFVAIVAISLGFLVVGGGAIVASSQWAQAASARRRAEELEQRRTVYLEGYERASRDVEAIAHLRHDARNELTVARFLAERGRSAEAASLLSAFAERLRCDPGTAPSDELADGPADGPGVALPGGPGAALSGGSAGELPGPLDGGIR